MLRLVSTFFLMAVICAVPLRAQEGPFFVTYNHYLEEPGNLEIATSGTAGMPRNALPKFLAPYTELEYGVTTRWTAELYLEGQTRQGDVGVFTGWRFENRFRPLAREHWINPVLYLEYESINEASRIKKEVVGGATDFAAPNAESRPKHAHELEGKLILSSNLHDWNIAANFIIEKNFNANEGLEFGYAVGIARPLSTLASSSNCRFCKENFSAGVEFFGGLGSTHSFGLSDTEHYAAPVLSWQVSGHSSLRFSPAIGLTSGSAKVMFRFGYSYEIQGFKNKVATLFHKERP